GCAIKKDIAQEKGVIASGKCFRISKQGIGPQQRIRQIRLWLSDLKSGLCQKSSHSDLATSQLGRRVGSEYARRGFELRLAGQRLRVQETEFPRVDVIVRCEPLDGSVQKRFGD